MPDNTIEWGQGAVNNTNDWGKAKANSTNNFGAVYDDSPSGDTNIAGGTGVALSISYSASAFCENASDPTPTVTGNVGAGTFSSTTGLVFVSTTTGEVDIDASTSGATYVITYTDTNAATATFNLTINDLDDATFAYSDSSYSQADADPTPTITGLAGGTFSAGSGLVFVDSGSNTGSSTGEIDLSASTIASYTVTYTTAGTCPNTSTQTVEIAAALAQVNNVYSMEFDGVNDYVTMGNVLNTSSTGASAFSMSCWFKTSASGSNQIMISKAKNSGQFDGYQLWINSTGEIFFFLGRYTGNAASSPWIYVRTTTTWNDGNWHNAVLTYNGNQNTSGLTLYVGGNTELLTSVHSNTPSISSTDSEFMIGAKGKSGDVGLFFEGKIDEVSFFDVELTAQEAQSIYLATETGKTADLDDLTTPPVKWYRMGD